MASVCDDGRVKSTRIGLIILASLAGGAVLVAAAVILAAFVVVNTI